MTIDAQAVMPGAPIDETGSTTRNPQYQINEILGTTSGQASKTHAEAHHRASFYMGDAEANIKKSLGMANHKSTKSTDFLTPTEARLQTAQNTKLMKY